MKASLQQSIAPNSMNTAIKEISAKETQGEKQEPKVDFKSILMNSNQEMKQKRESDNADNKDLSKAKNYNEFLDTLNKTKRHIFITLFKAKLKLPTALEE